ncbi:hypothetical protein AcW1_005357 [Taiwanofungus camphoratus]|nr:hypothetical protein AcW1_005357 [Antrodia cinnamomea]
MDKQERDRLPATRWFYLKNWLGIRTGFARETHDLGLKYVTDDRGPPSEEDQAIQILALFSNDPTSCACRPSQALEQEHAHRAAVVAGCPARAELWPVGYACLYPPSCDARCNYHLVA